MTGRLRAAGHDARQLRIPFAWEPAHRIVGSYLSFRMLDLEAYDRMIAFKFPAYCVSHPEKVVWLFHQFRQAYDLWGTPFQGLPSDEEGKRIRRAIIAADERHLLPCPRVYCNSIAAGRLAKYNDRRSVLSRRWSIRPFPLEDTATTFSVRPSRTESVSTAGEALPPRSGVAWCWPPPTRPGPEEFCEASRRRD